ncbi:MAG TPA: chromosome partitioning protein ParB [Candidatus Moranbacteria bacterium]|nr:chromosome partitioning protein ParB [Candidatus Moranbacteria bacterium]HAT74772.1 chromosome partitioning protein ParB [Candidatus Moranbacteria bacterium]
MVQNYGLGRGLSSLIPQKTKKITEPEADFNYFGSKIEKNNQEVASAQKLLEDNEIDISKIIPNPHQPRFHFDEIKLQELSDSIKEHGIIQPIVVSKKGEQYEIIAGERRFQAAKLAGLSRVPAIIREVSEQQKLELAIIENIQRHNLNPVEEARSYQKLMTDFDLSQEEISVKLGKNRSTVANKLRILNLPVEIQKALMEDKITEGHCKAILAIENTEKQKALFDLILKNGLTVRQTENKSKEVSVRMHKRILNIDPEQKALEDNLSQALNTRVKLQKSGAGGKIVIEFYSEEELRNIAENIEKIGK